MENPYLRHVLQAGLIQATEGEFKLKVNGSSMFPSLQSGDDIYVMPETIENFIIGDILVILRENDIVTHRLIKKDRNSIYCKGDNSHIPDPPVKATQVFGKVIAIEREGKRISYDCRYWINKNRALGWLGYLEYRVYRLGIRLINQQDKSIKNRPHISVGHIVFLPFRAIMRLISR